MLWRARVGSRSVKSCSISNRLDAKHRRLHFVRLAINRARDHFGRFGVARELRRSTGLDLQRAADSVADVRHVAEIGAGHRIDDRIMEILLAAGFYTSQEVPHVEAR